MYINLIFIKQKIHITEEAVVQCDSWNDESCDIGLDIQETDLGFQTSVNLPSAFFKHIIGRKAETKRRLENETKTQIKIPREGVEGDIGQCYIILITINFKVIYQRKKMDYRTSTCLCYL